MAPAFIALALLLPGCVMAHTQFAPDPALTTPGGDSVESTGYTSVGHVYANSWGLYLLAKVPYLTGGVDENGEPEWQYFADSTKVETVVQLLRAEALRRGATHLVDLKSDWLSEWSTSSVLFWIVEAQASANALRVTGTPPPGAIPLVPQS